MMRLNLLIPNGFHFNNQAIIAAQMKRNRRNATRRAILEQLNQRAIHDQGSPEPALQRASFDSQAPVSGDEHDSEPRNEEVVDSLDASLCETRPDGEVRIEDN